MPKHLPGPELQCTTQLSCVLRESCSVQVKGILDKEEVLFAKNRGYLYGTHVVVGLPECLAEASREPHAVPIMQHTRAVAVDEVDACFLVSTCCCIPPASSML